jgi:hypothetical protein
VAPTLDKNLSASSDIIPTAGAFTFGTDRASTTAVSDWCGAGLVIAVKGYHKPKLYLAIQVEPLSKQTPSRL